MPKARSDHWTIKALKGELTKRGVPYPKTSRKQELMDLYNAVVRSVDDPSNRSTSQEAVGTQTTLSDVSILQDDQIQKPGIASIGDTIITDKEDSSSEVNLSTVISTMNKMCETMATLGQACLQKETIPNASQSGATSHHLQSEAHGSFTLESAMRQPQSMSKGLQSSFINSVAPSSSPPQPTMSDGVPMSNLPQIEIISPAIRKDIIAGKDINLACLLMPGYKPDDSSRHMIMGNQAIPLKPLSDSRLNRNLTISEFALAFSIYKNVMCEAFPNRRYELDQYERCIVEMSSRFGGTAFYEYHKMFSAKAASYLLNYNVKVNWAYRDEYLFNSVFAGHKSIVCSLCSSQFHTTNFCPDSINNQSTTPQFKSVRSTVPQSKSNDPHTDRQGRRRVIHQGKEICNNFNTSMCPRNPCDFLHVCLSCKKGHPQMNCKRQLQSKGAKPDVLTSD